MATKVTLILDDKTEAAWRDLIANADAADRAVDELGKSAKRAGDSLETADEAADDFERMRKQVEELRHELEHLRRTSDRGIGKPSGGGAAAGLSAGGMIGSMAGALLTVEALKQGFAVARDAIREMAEDGDRAMIQLNDSIGSVDLAVKEMLRGSLSDAEGRLTNIGELARLVGDEVNLLISGKIGSTLQAEEAERLRKRVLNLTKEQRAEQALLRELQAKGIEQLKEEQQRAEFMLENFKGRLGGQEQAERLGKRILDIETLIVQRRQEAAAAAKEAAAARKEEARQVRLAFELEGKKLLDYSMSIEEQLRQERERNAVQQMNDLGEIEKQIREVTKARKQEQETAKLVTSEFSSSQEAIEKSMKRLQRLREKELQLISRKSDLEARFDAKLRENIVERERLQRAADAEAAKRQRQLLEESRKRFLAEIDLLKKKLLEEQKLQGGGQGQPEVRNILQRAISQQQVLREIQRQRALEAGNAARSRGESGSAVRRAEQQARQRAFYQAQRGQIGQQEVIQAQSRLAAGVLKQANASGNLSKKQQQALWEAALELQKQAQAQDELARDVDQIRKTVQDAARQRRQRAQRGGLGR